MIGPRTQRNQSNAQFTQTGLGILKQTFERGKEVRNYYEKLAEVDCKVILMLSFALFVLYYKKIPY